MAECRKCLRTISHVGVVVKETGHLFHPDCFRCEYCWNILEDRKFGEQNGSYYCTRDFIRRFFKGQDMELLCQLASDWEATRRGKFYGNGVLVKFINREKEPSMPPLETPENEIANPNPHPKPKLNKERKKLSTKILFCLMGWCI